MRSSPPFLGAVLAACLLGSPSALTAQEERGEPLLGQLRESLKSPAFSVGALFQFAADFQNDRTVVGENGFAVANARVRLTGELDGGVGYLFQSNFGSLLDLRLTWNPRRAFAVDGGLYKTPFSGEFLTPAGETDFVTRSRTVNALRPGRQVGVQVRGRVASGRLEYRIGAFNGGGGPGGNDDEHFTYGARLAYDRVLDGPSGGRLTVAVNGFTSDEPARYRGSAPEDVRFTGTDMLLGADLRATRGRWLGAAEWIRAEPDDDDPTGPEPMGWHLTVGFQVVPDGRILARWDAFRPEVEGIPDSDLVVLGYNHAPTGVTRLQTNVEIPTEDGFEPRLRLNAQLHF
ncbi:MAG: hypothetical protein GWM92_05705 [Gemmatimonadetes bacterium]|nr:hypothetical protein [Gemmatimonadota bacterium]NIR78078.1 hypothetical protein [Gemmatimonadota bacterium]NIT86645.1 hypothetical protein [Gemmatimonadota bacterium]NIU30498.1 hypothetical protein [Gemmatimonadota bacterium]NIU35345.1 hypothetical protein [Gemmatimonadota bacterium]